MFHSRILTLHIFATKLLNVHGYINIVFQTTNEPSGRRYFYNPIHTSVAQDVWGYEITVAKVLIFLFP